MYCESFHGQQLYNKRATALKHLTVANVERKNNNILLPHSIFIVTEDHKDKPRPASNSIKI